MQTPRRLAVLLGLALLAAPATAQVLTGTLFGTVIDESGGILPGAVIRVDSPALIGGAATVVSDAKGRFRLPPLAPGLYQLEITLPGFAPYRESGIQIAVQGQLERTVVLKLPGLTESISVQANTAVDAGRSGIANRFDAQQLRNIPVRRFSMFDFLKAAPGVSPTSPSSGTDASISILGSGGNENLYLLDGTNFTCPCSGGPQPQPDVDVIQEVHIDSLGASAEFGNIQGGVVNVVTKQGGDALISDLSYYSQMQALTSRPVLLACRNCGDAETGYSRVRYRDMTAHLGGPIVSDRIWFFGGYQYLRDADAQPGTDRRLPRTSEYDKVFGKVTWQATPRLRVLSSLHDEFWVSPQRPTYSQPFQATVRSAGTRPTTTFGQLTDVLSDRTLWDLRVSRFVAPQTSEPSTGDRTKANHVDLATGIQSGGPQGFGALRLERATVASSLSHYRSFLASDHELKVGAQIEHGQHRTWTAFQGGVVSYTDNAGSPVQAIFRNPATTGGEFVAAGVYAMDTARFGNRITTNLGVRFDHDRAVSPDLPAHDVEGHETGDTIRGLGTLYTWNVLSPRLGLALKLTGDGRTNLRASYGRFHQGILTGELAPVHPGLTPITTAAFDAATGQYTRIISVVDPTTNLRVDSATKSPRTDQIGVGVDRELREHVTVSASLVRKAGADFIGWTDTAGVYRPDTRQLADGSTIPVLVLTNGTAARRFLLTNPANYVLRYNGMLLAAERRWSAGWQAFASYTLSRTEGLEPSSGAAAGSGQFSSTFGGNPFGRDPNTLTNATGLLPNDRTHVFRLMGSAAVPRTRFVLAANLQHLTGVPWAATTQLSLPQGLTRILVETPGTRRLSPQTLLDLRLSRDVNVGRAHVELLLDVLDALDSRAEERLADDNRFSQNFGRPSVFVDPRRAMLGARLTFPR